MSDPDVHPPADPVKALLDGVEPGSPLARLIDEHIGATPDLFLVDPRQVERSVALLRRELPAPKSRAWPMWLAAAALVLLALGIGRGSPIAEEGPRTVVEAAEVVALPARHLELEEGVVVVRHGAVEEEHGVHIAALGLVFTPIGTVFSAGYRDGLAGVWVAEGAVRVSSSSQAEIAVVHAGQGAVLKPSMGGFDVQTFGRGDPFLDVAASALMWQLVGVLPVESPATQTPATRVGAAQPAKRVSAALVPVDGRSLRALELEGEGEHAQALLLWRSMMAESANPEAVAGVQRTVARTGLWRPFVDLRKTIQQLDALSELSQRLDFELSLRQDPTTTVVPRHQEQRLRLGVALLKRGRHAQGRSVLHAVADQRGVRGNEALFRLGESHGALGQLDLALTHFTLMTGDRHLRDLGTMAFADVSPGAPLPDSDEAGLRRALRALVDGKSSAARDNVTAWRRWEHPISAEVSSLMQDRRRLAAPDTELGRHVLRPGSSVEALAGEWRIWDLPEDVDPDVKRMAERERERVVAELEPEWMEALASFERDLSRSRRVASEIEARLRR